MSSEVVEKARRMMAERKARQEFRDEARRHLSALRLLTLENQGRFTTEQMQTLTTHLNSAEAIVEATFLP